MFDCANNISHTYPIDIKLPSVLKDPISHACVNGVNYFLLNDIEYIQYIFKNAEKYQRRGQFIDNTFELISQGLASTEGTTWQRQRRVIMPALTKNNLDAKLPRFAEITHAHLNDFDTHFDNNPVDVQKILYSLIADIILDTLFSTTCTKEVLQGLHEAVNNVDRFSSSISRMRKTPEGVSQPLAAQEEKYKKVFDDLVYGLLHSRRNNSQKPNDLLQLLLESQEKNNEISDAELHDEILTMIIAGVDPSMHALTWAIYLLSQNKEIEIELRNEAVNVMNKPDFGLEDLQNLNLATMIFKETIRLFPPVPLFHRLCMDDDTIGGVVVPQGSYVTISPWVLHHNEKYWDEPFKFKPDRFANVSHINPGFIPFGGGPHICAGQGIVSRTDPLILALFIKRYSFDLIPGQPVEPYAGAILRPRYPMRFKLTRMESL